MLCMFELDFDLDTVYRFLNERTPTIHRVDGAVGFAMRNGNEVLGAAIFYDYNGATIWAHVALGRDGFLPRGFLRAYLAYPFETCSVFALRGMVTASNARIRKLVKKLGGIEEAVLIGAGHGGEDLIVCTIFKKDLKA